MVRPGDFSAAFAPIEKNIKIPGHVAQILQQFRRVGIEGGEDESLVAVDLRDGNQSPLFPL